MTEDRRIGISALKMVSGMEHQVIDSSKASFSLIPRINAAGRIASSQVAVELLLAENRSRPMNWPGNWMDSTGNARLWRR